MTSKIVVNNIEADTGVSTVTFTSAISAPTFTGNVNATQANPTRLNVTGVSTFTSGPVLIGSGTSTGTASQRLQVTGGAYVSGSLGVGTASPGGGIALDVVGGEIRAGRVDTGSEGGQVSFSRSTDNATAWYLDVYGSTSTPSLRFVDVSNAAVRATLDGSGRLTLPYQPMFSAQTYTGNGNTVSAGIVAFRWATITLDVGSNFNNTTGLYTCPVAGKYLVNFNFNRRASFGNWTGLYIMQNSGATAVNSWFPPSSDGNYTYAPLTASYIFNCAANDTIAFCYHNGYSAPSTGTDGNFASILLVG